jgi:uncharacterized protein (DUF58 family)
MKRVLGILPLVGPALFPGAVIADTLLVNHQTRAPAHVVALVLAPLAVLALAVLALAGLASRRASRARPGVLTSTGHALAWSGAAAIVASTILGWASLAVVGLLGLGAVYAMVLWTAIAAGGDGWWARGEVQRRLVPEVATEGEPIGEEVRLVSVRVPAGCRLLAAGRVGESWPASRYAVSAEESGGEVLLESDLGPARRGEHHAPPLALWLEDIFGLCRTGAVHLGAASLVVLPRPGEVDGARQLLDEAGARDDAAPAQRLPSEGGLRLREYVPGDDARRIHWLRSLTARRLVVRQPDEAPRELPAVRLILDSFLPGADALACRAPAELLDQMVRVWLGVGEALARSGARVTLVAAVRREGGQVAVEERMLAPHATEEGLRLGARAAWQATLRVPSMLHGSGAEAVVSCRPQPQPDDARDGVRWIAVPARSFVAAESTFVAPDPPLRLPYPAGSPENRLGRRLVERHRAEAVRRDRRLFDDLCWLGESAKPASSGERGSPPGLRGHLVARPSRSSRIQLEAIP